MRFPKPSNFGFHLSILQQQMSDDLVGLFASFLFETTFFLVGREMKKHSAGDNIDAQLPWVVTEHTPPASKTWFHFK